jgi:hypothetical protein
MSLSEADKKIGEPFVACLRSRREQRIFIFSAESVEDIQHAILLRREQLLGLYQLLAADSGRYFIDINGSRPWVVSSARRKRRDSEWLTCCRELSRGNRDLVRDTMRCSSSHSPLDRNQW